MTTRKSEPAPSEVDTSEPPSRLERKTIFSRRSEFLRRVAQDDFERKQLIEKWLQLRRLLMWAALPLVISLLAFASGLTVYYLSLKNEKSGVTLFLKSVDIVWAFGGFLVVLTFTLLYFIINTDRSLKRLSSFRLDDTEPAPNAQNRTVSHSRPANPDEVIGTDEITAAEVTTEEAVITNPVPGSSEHSSRPVQLSSPAKA